MRSLRMACVLGVSALGCTSLAVPKGGTSTDVTANEPAAGGLDCQTGDADFGTPSDLRCTGLFDQQGNVAASAQAYDPGLSMWNDGATARRWVSLPEGQKIDTTDMNEWTFPTGTRFWQEIWVGKARVETRFFWKRGDDDWVRGTYVWASPTGPATYLATGKPSAGGSSYEIPSTQQCDTCHDGRKDRILGFDAVSLSSPRAAGLNMAALTSKGLLSAPPSGTLTIPDDGTGRGAPALGWLHANCGTSCHNSSPGSAAGSTGLWLRLDVVSANGTQSLGDYTSTNTYQTAVNVPARLAPYGDLGWRRISPNDPFTVSQGSVGTSLLPLMVTKRNDALQMPPIDTHVTDDADVAMLRDWITNGAFP